MNLLRRCAIGIAALALAASLAANAADAPQRPPQPLASPDLITRAEATLIAQAALDDCLKRGQPTSVVVVDATGFQRAAFSDDNAKLIGVVHSNRKAAAVLAFKVSTQVLASRLETDKQFAAQYGNDERYLFMAGGLPIYKAGKLVAVIAVGGAGNVNEECASAGLKALNWAGTEPPPRP